MLGGNKMGTILIYIGLFLIYLSETLMIMLYVQNEKDDLNVID